MRLKLLNRVCATTVLTLLTFSFGHCVAQSQQNTPGAPSHSAVEATRSKSLPGVFASVLPQIKARSHVPVLLPSELPSPNATAKHAVVETAEADEYGITLYYERESDGGYFGFAAFFSAEGKPKFSPRELPNVEPVNLAHGLHGFFRAVSCGGSCAPANLWWEEKGVLYVIQLELPSDMSDRDQENTIVAVVKSAIVGGPR